MSFERARQLSDDARKRVDSMLGLGPKSPREEILRAIGALRSAGRLQGDQGMLLDVVEAFLREGEVPR
jgi:hypothetical protein